MNDLIKSKKLKAIVFIYLCLGMMYASWGLNTLSFKHTIPSFIILGMGLLSATLWSGLLIFLNYYFPDYRKQVYYIACFSLIVLIILLLDYSEANSLRTKLNIVLLIAVIISEIIYIHKKKYHIHKGAPCLKESVLEKWYWLILPILGGLIAVFVGLGGVSTLYYRWDGFLYYSVCENLNIFSLSNMALYGHMAHGYSVIVFLCKVLVHSTEYAMLLANVLLYFIGVYYFNKLLLVFLKNISRLHIVLISLIFSFSPWTFGMIGYFSLDYACLCLTLPLLYYCYTREWGYFLVSSFFFCFTKEPAVILYAGFYLGLLIKDYWYEQNGKNLFAYIRKTLVNPRHYICVSPLLFWYITYNMLGPWSAGESGFTFSIPYIINKLKVLFVLNFNWIFIIGIIVAVLFFAIRYQWEVIIDTLPIVFGLLFFTCFSCIFVTVNHPRYSASMPALLYLLFVIYWNSILDRKYVQVVYFSLAVLLCASSFYTIDFISKKVFYKNDSIGKIINSTTTNILGDGMVYNFQAYWLEKAFCMSLNDALEEGNVILIPTYANNTYYFDGMAAVGGIQGKYNEIIEYWNTEKSKRTSIPSDKLKKFNVIQLANTFGINDLKDFKGKRLSFIHIQGDQESLTDEIKKSFDNWSEYVYEYRGWGLTRVSFSVK